MKMDSTQATPLEAAARAKERGNAHFRAGCREDALREFTTALSLLPADEQVELRATCLLNRAAVWLQLADDRVDASDGVVAAATAARDDCAASLRLLEEAQARDPASAPARLALKALFRRARAHELLGSIDEAVVDLASLVLSEARDDRLPPDEAVGSLTRLLTRSELPAEAALAHAVEALVELLSRGMRQVTASAPFRAVAGVSYGASLPVTGAAAVQGEALVTTEHKALAYAALLSVLSARSEARSPAMRMFLACGGPQLAHVHLHSMEGEWMLDAKRGTIRSIDAISRLPVVGRAMRALELSPHGLHAMPAGEEQHGGGCTH